MKIPIIKYSDKFLNAISLFTRVGGITLYPFIILREKYIDHPWYVKRGIITVNHESIHIKQQAELLVILFYLWYVIEWFIRLFLKGNAYRNISFEREAYENKDNSEYLKKRKLFSFLKYIY